MEKYVYKKKKQKYHKKQKLQIRFVLIMLFTIMTFIKPAIAANWVQDNEGWRWQEDDNSYSVNMWKEINSQWYWFDVNSYMVKGWKQIGEVWYYFDADGSMFTGWKQISENRYYLDLNGTMATGWRQINEIWYWFDVNGDMATDKWIGDYYVQEDGTMATNKWIGDYYVDDSGRWVNTKEHHNWSYFAESEIKNGYACDTCYKDITDYEDYFSCHLSFHAQVFFEFPTYYRCDNCNKLLHRHNWSYQKPTFYENSDEVLEDGYWICWGCGHQSLDGKSVNPVLISNEGYEYGMVNQSITPFNFEKDSNEWVVEDEQWELADNTPYLDHIKVNGISTMVIGDIYQEQVIFTPANPIEGKDVTWESSDSSILSVDSTGKVTALKAGSASITATASGKKDTIVISVKERKEDADSFYQKLADGFDVNVLIVGDSIAENGQGENGWCTLLRNNLRETYNCNVSFTNISMGGNSSYAGYVRTMSLDDDVNYDLAIICYGQNDSITGFSINYESIIRAIRSKYTDCSIISILESSQRSYTGKMTIIQNICEHYSIPIADTIAAFNNSGKDYKDLSNDGVHPNNAGQKIYFETVKSLINDKVAAYTGKMKNSSVINAEAQKFDNFAWYGKDTDFKRVDDTTFTLNTPASGILGIYYTYRSGSNKADIYVDGELFKSLNVMFNYGFSQRHILIVNNNCDVKKEIKIVFGSKEQADGFYGICFSWN